MFVGLMLWLLPLFVSQLMQLLERLPGLLAQAQGAVQSLFATFGSERTAEISRSVQGLVGTLSDVGTTLTRQLASWLSTALVPNVMALANDFVMFFLGLVMAYWFAKDYPAIMRELGVIAGPRHDDDLALARGRSRPLGGRLHEKHRDHERAQRRAGVRGLCAVWPSLCRPYGHHRGAAALCAGCGACGVRAHGHARGAVCRACRGAVDDGGCRGGAKRGRQPREPARDAERR